MTPFFQRVLIALSLATLLATPLTQQFVSPLNRLAYAWSPLDGYAILGLILFGAGVLLVGHKLLGLTRLRRYNVVLFSLLIALAAGATLNGILLSYGPKETWVRAFTVVQVSLTLFVMAMSPRYKERALRFYKSSLLILSPLLGVLAIQFLSFSDFSHQKETFVAALPPRSATPVFLFVFDEWSYRRSFQEETLKPFLKNVQGFASQATTFHQASSPATITLHSMPGLIFQTATPIRFDGAAFQFHDKEKRAPSREAASLFSLAKESGYNTASLGFYIHMRLLVGFERGLDYVNSMPFSVKSDTLLGTAGIFIAKEIDSGVGNVAKWLAPWFPSWVHRPVPALSPHRIRFWQKAYDYNRENTRRVGHILEQTGENVFLLGHYFVPHFPDAYEADGSFRPAPLVPEPDDEARYERNLHGLDHVIGTLLAELKKHDRYEQALIVITSDHSWRADPDFADNREVEKLKRRVPLFIKLPHQSAPASVATEVQTSSLSPLLEAAFAGDLPRMQAIIAGGLQVPKE